MKRIARRSVEAREGGFILLVCLILLLVLSLMATTAMQVAIVQERMAGNQQDQDRAFEAAESALRAAEAWLAAQSTLPVASTGSGPVWQPCAAGAIGGPYAWWRQRDAAWWAANAETLSGVAGVADQPQYLIEEYFREPFESPPNPNEPAIQRVLHRITARGVGGDARTEVLLQAIYLRAYATDEASAGEYGPPSAAAAASAAAAGGAEGASAGLHEEEDGDEGLHAPGPGEGTPGRQSWWQLR